MPLRVSPTTVVQDTDVEQLEGSATDPVVKEDALAATTASSEGAKMVGTDAKSHLGNATTLEAAVTAIDTFVGALASTTASTEGAKLVGTDTKTNLGSATTVEAALTAADSFVAALALTTAGSEGAKLIGTDAKTNLGSATTVEAALTAVDSHVAALGSVTPGSEGATHIGTDSKTHLNNAETVEAALTAIDGIVTLANDVADTEAFLLFTPTATGTVAPKTNAGLAVNAATAEIKPTQVTVQGNGTGSGGSATVVNLMYGTSDPPDPAGIPYGTLYAKYTA